MPEGTTTAPGWFRLQEENECDINIDEDGSLTILATNQEHIDNVVNYVKALTTIPKNGDIFSGEVVRILEFGAFVKLTPNKDGLLHISELKHERVNKVTDCVKIGDTVDVKVIKVDDTGRISLSMKALIKKDKVKW